MNAEKCKSHLAPFHEKKLLCLQIEDVKKPMFVDLDNGLKGSKGFHDRPKLTSCLLIQLPDKDSDQKGENKQLTVAIFL